jgi:hypothetical protein
MMIMVHIAPIVKINVWRYTCKRLANNPSKAGRNTRRLKQQQQQQHPPLKFCVLEFPYLTYWQFTSSEVSKPISCLGKH